MPTFSLDMRRVARAFNTDEMIRPTGGLPPAPQADGTMKVVIFLSNGGTVRITHVTPEDASAGQVMLFNRAGEPMLEAPQPLSDFGESLITPSVNSALMQFGVPTPAAPVPTPEIPHQDLPQGSAGEGSGCGGNCSACGCGGAHSKGLISLEPPIHTTFGVDLNEALDQPALYLVPLIVPRPGEVCNPELSVKALRNRVFPLAFTSQEAASAFILGHYLSHETLMLTDLAVETAAELLPKVMKALRKDQKLGCNVPLFQTYEDREVLLQAIFGGCIGADDIDELQHDLLAMNQAKLPRRN